MRLPTHAAFKLCLTALVIGFASAHVPEIYAKCPNCYKDAEPLNTTKNQDGSVSTAPDGRAKVSWRIDGSWDAQPGTTNPRFWDGAVAAFQQWNEARGVNNEPSKYSFHQEQQWGQATITLTKDTRGRLAKTTCNYFPEMLIDYIKHEIAHALGLAHPSEQDRSAGC
jgi:hypothetical protein